MPSNSRFEALLAAFLFAACGCSSSTAPQKASAQLRFGARVARQGYWQEARFRFQQAVALDPGNPHAHNDLAVALEAVGEFGAAFDEYKKAVSLAGADKAIHQNYTKFAEFYSAYTKRIGKVNSAP
ncbi:MAG: tetratricopeptide repeat protein [Thermoanaerobaculia bacterium]